MTGLNERPGFIKARRSCCEAASISVTATVITSMTAQVCRNWNARMISYSTWPISPAPTRRMTNSE